MGNNSSTPQPEIKPENLTEDEIQERRRMFLKYGVNSFIAAYEIHIRNYFHPPSSARPEIEGAMKTGVNKIQKTLAEQQTTLADNVNEASSHMLDKIIPIIGFVLGKGLRKVFEIREKRSHMEKGEKIAGIFSGYEDQQKMKTLLTDVFNEIYLWVFFRI